MWSHLYAHKVTPKPAGRAGEVGLLQNDVIHAHFTVCLIVFVYFLTWGYWSPKNLSQTLSLARGKILLGFKKEAWKVISLWKRASALWITCRGEFEGSAKGIQCWETNTLFSTEGSEKSVSWRAETSLIALFRMFGFCFSAYKRSWVRQLLVQVLTITLAQAAWAWARSVHATHLMQVNF